MKNEIISRGTPSRGLDVRLVNQLRKLPLDIELADCPGNYPLLQIEPRIVWPYGAIHAYRNIGVADSLPETHYKIHGYERVLIGRKEIYREVKLEEGASLAYIIIDDKPCVLLQVSIPSPKLPKEWTFNFVNIP